MRSQLREIPPKQHQLPIESTSPIPLTQELEHTEEYLKIEKIRFGNRLNIEYDIQTEEFCVPSLSVQSMVENAVKHGVCKVAGGGTGTLSTRELPNCFEVEISDNGAGFDVDEAKLGGPTSALSTRGSAFG